MGATTANWPYVINLGNSIIGVSVLAMPFCFNQCGLLLGTVLLMCSAGLTHFSCNLLMKGAVSARRRSYEFLAYHAFGHVGKLAVELSIIGLLLGTCVAFYVIIGDLGPAIISKITGFENSAGMRNGIMVFLGVCVALPLGLCRNVESLSNISAISLGFYAVFVLNVFATAFPILYEGLWVSKVNWWLPAGVFKCLPIFSLAFACQTQLFVMYDALPEPSLNRMTHIAKSAIFMCTMVYLLVGFFGCIAFCEEEVMGDILMNFRQTIFTECIKIGFVLSVAVSFPLVIFPCRASIYTLLFSKDPGHHDGIQTSIYIPPMHFKCITAAIVLVTLVIGILVPNIELVLALTGATMGSMICFIFPAVTYISVASITKGAKSGNSKPIAQLVLFLGFTILVASTYVTLRTDQQADAAENIANIANEMRKQNQDGDLAPIVHDDAEDEDDDKEEGLGLLKDPLKPMIPEEHLKEDEGAAVGGDAVNAAVNEEKRQEPPNPQAPPDSEENRVAAAKKIELVDNAAAALDHKAAEDKEIQLAPPEHKEEEPIVNEGGAAVMEPEKKDAVKVMANKVPEEIGQVGALDQDQADQQPKLQAPEGNEDSNQAQAGVNVAVQPAEAKVLAPVVQAQKPDSAVDQNQQLQQQPAKPVEQHVQAQQQAADHHHEEEIAQMKDTNQEAKQLLQEMKAAQQENIKLIHEQKQILQEIHEEKKSRQQQERQQQQGKQQQEQQQQNQPQQSHQQQNQQQPNNGDVQHGDDNLQRQQHQPLNSQSPLADSNQPRDSLNNNLLKDNQGAIPNNGINANVQDNNAAIGSKNLDANNNIAQNQPDSLLKQHPEQVKLKQSLDTGS